MTSDHSFKAGDTHNSGVLAQGQHARADGAQVFAGGAAAESAESRELQRRVEELQRLLTQYAAQLPDAGELSELTRQLTAQLNAPEPSRPLIRSVLASLTAGAGGVGAVATAVNGVAQLVSRVLH